MVSNCLPFNAYVTYLGHLRPSRDLLEYYRRKIAEYDEEYEKLVGKLEKYRCTYEDVVGRKIQ